jgi:hypothetical protein
MAPNIPKVDADRHGIPRLSAWNFGDEVLRGIFHGNSLSPIRKTCSLENVHLTCLWLQRDSDAEALQSLHKMSLEPFRMKLIEVVAAEFFIRATVALKVIADDQQAMSNSD